MALGHKVPFDSEDTGLGRGEIGAAYSHVPYHVGKACICNRNEVK